MSASERGEVRRGGAFFGRRKGHPLRPRQAALMERLLPRLALDLRAPAPDRLAALFPDPADEIGLEIGFRGGGHPPGGSAPPPPRGVNRARAFLPGQAEG